MTVNSESGYAFGGLCVTCYGFGRSPLTLLVVFVIIVVCSCSILELCNLYKRCHSYVVGEPEVGIVISVSEL